MSERFLLLGCALALVACAGEQKRPKVAGRAESLDIRGSGGERCDGTKPEREVNEYDTSGDGVPDVRKVYVALGTEEEARLVMICRESDVNGDGRKDVIRYYDDNGRSLREEQDRDFDGRMDMILVFQDGQPRVKEIDGNGDGKVDTKIFLEKGQPERAERDLAGRSTPQQWRPDRWEYYQEGRMVRMGTDLDGDSKVDRWDRDHEHKIEDGEDAMPMNPEQDEPSAPPASSAAAAPASKS
jgi:hypothetical protein